MNVSTHNSSHILLLGMSHLKYSFEVQQISPNVPKDGDMTTTISPSVPNTLIDQGQFQSTMNEVSKKLLTMFRDKQCTEMDGRDLYRIIALELLYKCKCYTISLVKNEGRKFNEYYHNDIDYNSKKLVPSLQTKYETRIQSFDEIYFDYYWMIHSAEKYLKNLFEKNIPSLMTKLMKVDGKMYLPFCSKTVEWIVTFQEKYESLMEISFISKNDLYLHKLCHSTRQLNAKTMETIFAKTLYQEEEENICKLKLSNVKCMHINSGTTVDNIEKFLLKHVGNDTMISDTRFIVLSRKKTKSANMETILQQLFSKKLSHLHHVAAITLQDQHRRLVYYTTLVKIHQTPKHFLPNSFINGSILRDWIVRQNEFYKIAKETYKIKPPSDVSEETVIDVDESVLIDHRVHDEFDEGGDPNEEEEDDGEGYEYFK